MNLMKKLAEEGQNHAANNPQRTPSKNSYSSHAVSSSASSNLTALDNGREYEDPVKDE